MNNQNDLHDDVDPKLQKLYQQLPKEQPSAELDAKILTAAKITKPQPNLKKSPRWQAPFALAASVVLVSSVALYLYEENPAAFEVKTESTQTPTPNISKIEPAPAVALAKTVNDANATNDHAQTHVLADNADQKIITQKAKNTPSKQQQKAQTTSTDAFNDHQLTAQAEKKAEITDHADQVAEADAAKQAAILVHANKIAKEQETQLAKAGSAQFTTAQAAPIIAAPAPQMQPDAEVTERPSIPASRLQNYNHMNQQSSAASAESDQPALLEKSNYAPALATAPMAAASAAPMSAGSLASAAMPMAKQRDKLDSRDEATTVSYAQNISAPVLSIENIAIGMNREQLVAQGMTCYVDVCHLDIEIPRQEMYWGIAAQNAHLTVFLSHQVTTKLVLQQKNAQFNQVKTALSNVGIASEKSCVEEKGTLLIGRQLGVNLFNIRAMGTGLSLTICQYTKSTK